jgi:hypothetical protein
MLRPDGFFFKHQSVATGSMPPERRYSDGERSHARICRDARVRTEERILWSPGWDTARVLNTTSVKRLAILTSIAVLVVLALVLLSLLVPAAMRSAVNFLAFVALLATVGFGAALITAARSHRIGR